MNRYDCEFPSLGTRSAHDLAVARTAPRIPGPPWLEPLVQIPVMYRGGLKSPLELFTEANPDLSDRSRFVNLVADRLKNDSALVRTWQDYSADKRVDSGPYLDGTKVGYYSDGQYRDKRSHPKPYIACADFIFREAQTILEPNQRN